MRRGELLLHIGGIGDARRGVDSLQRQETPVVEGSRIAGLLRARQATAQSQPIATVRGYGRLTESDQHSTDERTIGAALRLPRLGLQRQAHAPLVTLPARLRIALDSADQQATLPLGGQIPYVVWR
jgi:hypothetical protein